jgi:hypothetical protein
VIIGEVFRNKSKPFEGLDRGSSYLMQTTSEITTSKLKKHGTRIIYFKHIHYSKHKNNSYHQVMKTIDYSSLNINQVIKIVDLWEWEHILVPFRPVESMECLPLPEDSLLSKSFRFVRSLVNK